LVAVALTMLSVAPVVAADAAFANPAFETVWNRTDQPIAGGQVSRTWMWGPAPFSEGLREPYAQSPGGQRLVQYFDKSRMEINDPNNPSAVTNGLLSKELITGEIQTGDAAFEERSPARIPVAGDPDDTGGPLYATFRELLSAPPTGVGQPIVATLNRDGTRGNDGGLSRYGVTAAYLVPETNHAIASPFWSFLNIDGPVNVGGKLETAKLFEPIFFATGLPISEPYWAKVKVAGQVKDVLVQAFERRVLTYTPANPEAFQVEMGNVGRHYYAWRYEGVGAEPEIKDASQIVLTTEELPGYLLREERWDEDKVFFYRLFQDLNRVENGYPLVQSAAAIAPNPANAAAAFTAITEQVQKELDAPQPVAGLGEQAVIFVKEQEIEDTKIR
jgi:hypothetical protein